MLVGILEARFVVSLSLIAKHSLVEHCHSKWDTAINLVNKRFDFRVVTIGSEILHDISRNKCTGRSKRYSVMTPLSQLFNCISFHYSFKWKKISFITTLPP